jgi:glycosyltransferase 2 family protein
MTEQAAVPRRSGGWKLAARIAVTVLFLTVLVFRAKGVGRVLPTQHHVLTGVLLGSAVVMTAIGVVLSAWRWQRVLLLFDATPHINLLSRHYLASLFIGTTLPSTIGGDVLRVSRASETIPSTSAFASVVLERLTGFVALPLLVAVGFIVRPSLLDIERTWWALLIAGITLVVLLAILYLAGHPRIAGRFAESEGRARFIGAVHLGVDRLRRNPGQALPILGTALLYQLSVIAVFALVFRALDLGIPLAATVALSPAVLMIQVLPISISGLGVREGAIAFFFHGFGINTRQALAAGLLWFGCLVIVSMLGAPAFLGHKKAENAA